MKKLPKLETIEWDYIADDHPPCPVCKVPWKDAPAIYVSEELGIASISRKSQRVSFFVTNEQARILQVLRSAFGRWNSAEEILDLAYSDLPDIDKPDNIGAVTRAISALNARMKTTTYVISRRNGYGYSLTTNKVVKQHAKDSERTKHKRKAKAERAKPALVARRAREVRSGAARREGSPLGAERGNSRARRGGT